MATYPRAWYHIVSVRTVGIIEAAHIVQGHRLDIFDDLRSYFPAPCKSLPTYLISSMWPVLIGSSRACTASSPARPRRRVAFASLLSAHSALTPARYLRLTALALLTLTLLTPAHHLALNTTASPLSPWRSFADTHSDYGHVGQVPRFLWTGTGSSWVAVEMTRWAGPACAGLFFAFFGGAVEARRNYALAWGRASSTSAPPKIQAKTKPISLPLHPSSSSPSKSFASSPSKSFSCLAPTTLHSSSYYSDAELKRAPSSSSSFFSSPAASEAGSSRFVERFPASASASDPAAASQAVEVRHVHLELDPPTPATATSFTSISSTETAAYAHALSLYLGWAARPYAAPASVPASPSARDEEEGEGEREEDARSVHLEMGFPEASSFRLTTTTQPPFLSSAPSLTTPPPPAGAARCTHPRYNTRALDGLPTTPSLLTPAVLP
ncbi:pheromone A receptor-domain-containing protein [Mycena latifolia]|nr:pheromone A receptor-domain-containing protein [Mycena latifolia]